MWPKVCGVDDCERETAVALLRVIDAGGRVRCNAASTFLLDKRETWVLRDGYTFDGWLVRCGECRSRETAAIERMQAARLEAQDGSTEGSGYSQSERQQEDSSDASHER